MKLESLSKHCNMPKINFSKYERETRMPPLNTKRINLKFLSGSDRNKIKTPYNGDIIFVLNYKEIECTLCSLEELSTGEIWNILQLQGAKSKKSYRLITSLNCSAIFAETINQFASLSNAEVCRIIMSPTNNMKNVFDAVSAERLLPEYLKFAELLKLRYSKKENLFIRDLKRKK